MANRQKDKLQELESVSSSPSFSLSEMKKFFIEVKVEFGKIVWPDKKMTLGLTGIVVVMAIILSIYLGSVDMIIGKIVGSFLR